MPHTLSTSKASQYFQEKTEFTKENILPVIEDTLHRQDDGELFVEKNIFEVVSFDDGRIKSANYSSSDGFGLRAVSGEMQSYAHSNEMTLAALKKASQHVTSSSEISDNIQEIKIQPTNRKLYDEINPLELIAFDEKVTLMGKIDAFARKQDTRVIQVQASLALNWQSIWIIRADGEECEDVRPLCRFNISVIMEHKGRRETGSHGWGTRMNFTKVWDDESWQHGVLEAIRQASVNMESIPAPAGTMEVVLGSGWPGILLHEAVGHGLEGDFNRKETSSFAGIIGEQVAAKGVTVVDDGTIEGRRGSLNIDDEGTPTQKTVLIEDGILKAYMQDRQNGRLMKEGTTGNCRRESYAYLPQVRMTNTYMEAGQYVPEEIIASVKDGIYATSFGGGQVDITNGKFVFSCTEAYKIEDGKLTAPLKGATLIGSGPEVLKYITMIGNDMKLDSGIGTCGKNGQGVPVGVGQPTIRLNGGLTVGGTETA